MDREPLGRDKGRNTATAAARRNQVRWPEFLLLRLVTKAFLSLCPTNRKKKKERNCVSGVWVQPALCSTVSPSFMMMEHLWPCFPPPHCRLPTSPARPAAFPFRAPETLPWSACRGAGGRVALNLREASFLPPPPSGLASPQNTFLEKERGGQEPGPRSRTSPSSEPASSGLGSTWAF